ncbi:MAG: glycosyltransferase family 4 protein [Candidatus Peribacteraceae bacterium]|nr:glycosyltransferase family 4 protein [Candidatus Peribacteraceae bacterium]
MIPHTRRKALFLDQYGHIGGGQRILLDLVSGLSERDWTITVLCPKGPLQEKVTKAGGRTLTLDLPSMRNGAKSLRDYLRGYFAGRRAAKKFAALAKEQDLIVVNGLRTIVAARQWLRTMGKPTVLYLHGKYSGLQRLLLSSLLRSGKVAAIAPSPHIAAPFGKRNNLFVVPNWVSPEFLSLPAMPGLLRSALRLADDLPLVLIPGRYSLNKGQLLLLAAMEECKPLSFHLVFAGAALFERSGREVEQTLKRAAIHAPDRIHLIHWQSPAPALYDDADLVVVPSQWEEPFGLTAIEAMARGRPLLVTRRGMLPDIAGNGQFAEVVEPEPRALLGAVQDFFRHRTHWQTRGQAAREHIRKHYHPDIGVQKVAQLFVDLLSR